MVEISEIDDRKSLEAWLKALPQGTEAEQAEARRVAVSIAARAVARVLPLYWHWALMSKAARDRDVTALPVLRSVLISAVAALVPTADIKDAANAANAAAAAASTAANAANAAAAAASTAVNPNAAASTAANAANAAAAAASTAVNPNAAAAAAVNADAAAAKAAYAAAHAADAAAAKAAANAAWEALRRDCTVLAEGRDVFAEPLWVGQAPFAEAWAKIQAEVAKADHDWRFWVAWYAQMLDPAGRAPNWAMLERIALIQPMVWDGPVDAALAAINGIWEQYQIRDEALALTGELGAVDSRIAPVHRRSHNNPPELLDAPQPVQRAVATLGESLDDAIEELSESEPDKARLVRIATELLAALKVIAGYCGKVADAAVVAGAKAVGTGSGIYVVDQYLLNGRLWDFASRLLNFGGG